MKMLQDNFVKGLPKIIIFGIAFYNFVWIVWQNLNHFSACVICLWYITDSFPIEAFLLLVAAYLLFIPHWIAKTFSVFTSGYFVISWGLMIVNWFWTTDYSLSFRIKIIMSSYFGHPLQIWESQIVLGLMIFVMAIYSLKKQNSTQIMP